MIHLILVLIIPDDSTLILKLHSQTKTETVVKKQGLSRKCERINEASAGLFQRLEWYAIQTQVTSHVQVQITTLNCILHGRVCSVSFIGVAFFAFS